MQIFITLEVALVYFQLKISYIYVPLKEFQNEKKTTILTIVIRKPELHIFSCIWLYRLIYVDGDTSVSLHWLHLNSFAFSITTLLSLLIYGAWYPYKSTRVKTMEIVIILAFNIVYILIYLLSSNIYKNKNLGLFC